MSRPRRSLTAGMGEGRAVAFWTVLMLVGIVIGGAIGFLLVAVYH